MITVIMAIMWDELHVSKIILSDRSHRTHENVRSIPFCNEDMRLISKFNLSEKKTYESGSRKHYATKR
jgi:hypothetical protein